MSQPTSFRSKTSRLTLSLLVVCLLSPSALNGQIGTMQIVAHQDDDILFMNPDLRNSVQAGVPSTTVYVTAGEASGGSCDEHLNCVQTREQFSASRQEGARAGYATMMNVSYPGFTDISAFPKPIDNVWTRSLCIIEGEYVEVDQLNAAPQVQLVFLNILEAGDVYWLIFNPEYPLVGLWDGTGAPVPTLVPENWPTQSCVWPQFAPPGGVPGPSYAYYDHPTLVKVLQDIVQTVQPAIVRTLDPYPFELVCGSDVTHITCYPPNDPPGTNPQYTGYLIRFDNSDHQDVGRFVRETLGNYSGHRLTMNYIGYSIADRQGNLSDLEYGVKQNIVNAYGQYDLNYQDAEVDDTGSGYKAWFGAMYERNPSNTTWLQSFPDGRLAAFGIKADRPAMWYQVHPGSSNWYGPIALGNDSGLYGPVATGIAVGRRRAQLQLFFLRMPQPPMLGSPQICTVAQNATTDTFGEETCLGTPSLTNPNHTSTPAVVTSPSGLFWIFVKNDMGGVSANHEISAGTWSGWSDLPGDPAIGDASGEAPDVLEGIVATVDAIGRVQVFAQSRFGVIHQWYQSRPGGAWLVVPVFPANAPVYQTHGLAVGRNADGTLEVLYRAAGRPDDPACGAYGCDAQVFSVREEFPGGPWSVETDLFGDAGHGPLAVVRHPQGPLFVFEKNYFGGVSGIAEQTSNGSFFPFQWTGLGGIVENYPSAFAAGGRITLAGFGTDGRLYINRQQGTAASDPFSGWTLVDFGTTP